MKIKKENEFKKQMDIIITAVNTRHVNKVKRNNKPTCLNNLKLKNYNKE